MQSTNPVKRNVYRVHYTCLAGHTTHTDYKSRQSAVKHLRQDTDPLDWYATHIDFIIDEYPEWVNGMWETVTHSRPFSPRQK